MNNKIKNLIDKEMTFQREKAEVLEELLSYLTILEDKNKVLEEEVARLRSQIDESQSTSLSPEKEQKTYSLFLWPEKNTERVYFAKGVKSTTAIKEITVSVPEFIISSNATSEKWTLSRTYESFVKQMRTDFEKDGLNLCNRQHLIAYLNNNEYATKSD